MPKLTQSEMEQVWALLYNVLSNSRKDSNHNYVSGPPCLDGPLTEEQLNTLDGVYAKLSEHLKL